MSTEETKVGYAAPVSARHEEDEAETTFYDPASSKRPCADADDRPDATAETDDPGRDGPGAARTAGEERGDEAYAGNDEPPGEAGDGAEAGDGQTVVMTPNELDDDSLPLLDDHTPYSLTHSSTADRIRLGESVLRRIRISALERGAMDPTRRPGAAAGAPEATTKPVSRYALAFAGSVLAGLIVGGLAIGIASRGDDEVAHLAPISPEITGADGIVATEPERVDVEIAATPSEADVFVDGQRISGGEFDRPCNGPVSIRVWAPGYVAERYTIECGRSVMLIVNLAREPAGLD